MAQDIAYPDQGRTGVMRLCLAAKRITLLDFFSPMVSDMRYDRTYNKLVLLLQLSHWSEVTCGSRLTLLCGAH